MHALFEMTSPPLIPTFLHPEYGVVTVLVTRFGRTRVCRGSERRWSPKYIEKSEHDVGLKVVVGQRRDKEKQKRGRRVLVFV